jgi:hypothetical protein
MLSGGQGFCATEPLREDTPLLGILGLNAAPSAKTVERVTKHLGGLDGQGGLGRLLAQQASRLIQNERRHELLDEEGWLRVWGDGTVLEVEGRNFEACKNIDGKWGQLAAGCFVGPYLTAIDFAGEGEGEQSLVRRFLAGVVDCVVRPLGFAKQTLVLLDSLHGDGPTLDLLESPGLGQTRYVVGANKLARAAATLSELPEFCWVADPARETARRGWTESALATCWVECEGWSRKRLCVGRRYKKPGDMIYYYSAVLTNIERDNPRVLRLMKRKALSFEQAVWHLYNAKQAMENQWKDLLIDLGLHHPPSAKVRANAAFYAMAALAYNLATGLRRLLFTGADRVMRLWRVRRETFGVPARVARHGREVMVRLLDARPRIVNRILVAMTNLMRL